VAGRRAEGAWMRIRMKIKGFTGLRAKDWGLSPKPSDLSPKATANS